VNRRIADPALSAAVSAVAYVALGFAVSTRPPDALDQLGELIAGDGVPVALFFTNSGLFPIYVGVCVALLGFALVRRDWLARVLLSIVTLVIAWRVSDLGKDYFHRPRPPYWYARHEPSYSYASGHTTLSLAFYGFWIYLLWNSGHSLRVRGLAVALLAAWIALIAWSRLALGAHYATDVVGGWLLGLAALLLAVAVARTGRFAGSPHLQPESDV
jgi:undecaprenyl-diphosphatase